MESYEVTYYMCPRCTTPYTSEEKAEYCNEIGKKIEEYDNNLKPWNWYIIKSKSSDKVEKIFARRVVKSKDYEKSCLDKHLEIYDYCWNQYFCIPTNWELLEVLTPREAYDKYGLVIELIKNNCFGEPQIFSIRKGMPVEVAKEVDKIREEDFQKKINEVISSNSAEELAKRIIISENPFYGYNFTEQALSEEDN